MGNSSEKIETCEIPEYKLMYPDPPLPHRHHPPFRRFLKVQEKKKARFVSYTLTITDPYQENITVTAQVFDRLFDAYSLKTQNIFVQNVLKQSNIIDRWIFLVDTNGNKESLLVRPYTDESSHNFASILCELYFTKEVALLPCKTLHQYIDNYVVCTGMDGLSQPNSHVIVMERVDATLSEIIAFKREHLWDWTIGEFHRLTSDLVDAVHALHEIEITHNDIRPSVVYYSLKRKCYVLGSFDSCMKQDGDSKGGTILRTSSRRTISQLQSEISRKQYDIYMLGMTLLSAFYLSEIIDLEIATKQNQIMIKRYEILFLINAMLAPPDKRATIIEIKKKMPPVSNKDVYMQEMISSMKHREKQTPEEAVLSKAATAFAYKHLGLWNQWKKEYEEACQLTEAHNGPDQADGLVTLALIEHCRGDYRSSDNFAKDAALKYRELGKRQLDQHSLGAAESYYKKAVSCAKYYELDPDPDISLSLSGLSLVHRDKGNMKYAMTLAKAASDSIAKADGKNTIQYGIHHLKEGRLFMKIKNHQNAQKIIEYCLTLADRLKQVNHEGSIALKGECLAAKAKNYDSWGESLPEYEQHMILDKAKLAAKEAAQVYMCIEEDHHVELADVVRTVGLINIKRRNYYESVREYTRAIEILQTYEQEHHTEQLKEKAEILCLKGNAHSLVGEHEEGVEDYMKALTIYKLRYGSHHNRPSAVAIGNLGKIYAHLKQAEQARVCFKSSLQILNDIASSQDPDYLNFHSSMRDLN